MDDKTKKERSRLYTRKWREAHPEYRYKYDRERARESKKKYQSSEKGKSYYRKWVMKYRSYNRNKLFEILGDRCSNISCLVPGGCKDIRCLQIDHVNGWKGDRKKRTHTDEMITYYLTHPDEIKDNIQLLCANCNWIKKYEKNENKKRVTIKIQYDNLQAISCQRLHRLNRKHSTRRDPITGRFLKGKW